MQLVTLITSVALLAQASASGVERYIKQSTLHAQVSQNRTYTSSKPSNTSSYRYLNSKTKQYQVTSLPDFNFDIGEFYSGSVPIDDKNRTLFFAFKPTTGPQNNDLTIWLNGGPGCSSLSGLIDENGPWTWQPGTYRPVKNPYAWSNLTNMLWVEQPVGTGFSRGSKKPKNEEEVAADFVLWFKNFQKAFDISKYNIYITGESYAGLYVPYISQAFLNQEDTTYYNLKGGMIYDPVIGSEITQFDTPIAPFALANQNQLNLNSTTLAKVRSMDKACGYEAYREKYFTFPPPAGGQPTKYTYPSGLTAEQCDISDLVYYAASQVNPCFNIYSINTQCPLLWDVLGFPGGHEYIPVGTTAYFNRADVKRAMHAPMDVEWAICNNGVLSNDNSADSTVSAIPQVVDSTKRFLIANGDFDMILITNGTLFAIQNMTWGGKTGFQQRPATPIIIQQADLQYGEPGPQGVIGIQHQERGLMWAETFAASHMGPESQPRASLRFLLWVLGRIDSL